jgi:eukaryotic-like serine/threonine-protein kinase
LAGLPLKQLHLVRTPVTDLSPLASCALEELRVKEMSVTDLSVLSRAPLCDSLSILFLESLKVTDFSAVSSCKSLRVFSAFQSSMTDLAPLRGIQLEVLYISGTKVRDLSALAGMPLENIYFDLTPVTDVTPLQRMPTLKYVILPEEAENIEALRTLPNLLRLSFHFDPKVPGPSKTAAEFWKTWDRDEGCVAALRRDRVKFSTHRREDGALSITIEDLAFKDLAVFRGANLASLTLIGTSVSDLTPLADLPLKNLQLRRNPATDLSPLASCALEELKVREMPVTDISVLGRAPLCDSLATLWLEQLQVTNFSPVSACKALRTLSAWQTHMADVAPLRGLRLKNLFIQGTKVHDLSALAGMPLEELFFDFTTVTDITPLQDISSLKKVMLSETAKEVQTLRKLPNLERISYFWDSKARKPSMTAAEFWALFDANAALMTRLRDAGIEVKALKPLNDGTCEVNLEASTIKDLTLLSAAPISILRLGGTHVTDLSPLRGLPLKKLYLQNTMVSDLSPLKGMQLESLHVSGTRVIDLSPVKGMPLESFNVSETSVADLSALRGMPLLHLRLHQCPNIVDLSPLRRCTSLSKLTLPAQAKDLEFLRKFPKLELLSFTEDLTTLVPDRTAAKFWEEHDVRRQ